MTIDTAAVASRTLHVSEPFDLAVTCGPVHWTTGRSPRHRWDDGALTWVGWEADRIAWRTVRQVGPGALEVWGNGSPDQDAAWGAAVLGSDIHLPPFDDPVIAGLVSLFPGLHPYCDGSLFEGVITAIVGQSISVAAAAVTQARLAALFNEAVGVDGHELRPLPSAAQLAGAPASLVRESGVTWKRAEAIVVAAREAIAGNLPTEEDARTDPERVVTDLMRLPLVGRWTAESVVLWGVGAPNAHPTGDVALLRAARAAYAMPELTLKDLDALAERWRPARGLAARLLWTALFGPAPTQGDTSHEPALRR